VKSTEARLTSPPLRSPDPPPQAISAAAYRPGAPARVGIAIALAIFLADQASKLWLIYGFDLGSRGMVPLAPFLDLVLTWNTGISYGLFPQNSELGRWLLIGFSAAAIAILGIWLVRAHSRLTAVALGLIIGGAAGNAVDRLAYGAVADFVFFHVPLGSWEFRWYVFNLADVAIVAGVIGLLYESIFPARAAKAP
jgi:signal peptidase II